MSYYDTGIQENSMTQHTMSIKGRSMSAVTEYQIINLSLQLGNDFDKIAEGIAGGI